MPTGSRCAARTRTTPPERAPARTGGGDRAGDPEAADLHDRALPPWVPAPCQGNAVVAHSIVIRLSCPTLSEHPAAVRSFCRWWQMIASSFFGCLLRQIVPLPSTRAFVIESRSYLDVCGISLVAAATVLARGWAAGRSSRTDYTSRISSSAIAGRRSRVSSRARIVSWMSDPGTSRWRVSPLTSTTATVCSIPPCQLVREM